MDGYPDGTGRYSTIRCRGLRSESLGYLIYLRTYCTVVCRLVVFCWLPLSMRPML